MSHNKYLSDDYLVRETQIRTWFEKVLKTKFTSLDLSEILYSGYYLCELMLCLDPKSIPRVHGEGCASFLLRENVEFFIQGMQEYGVPQSTCFRATDLINKRNMNLVFTSLIKLSDIAESKNFPILLPPLETINPPTLSSLTPSHQRIIKNLGRIRSRHDGQTRIAPIVPPRST